MSSISDMEQYRLQLYNYALNVERLRNRLPHHYAIPMYRPIITMQNYQRGGFNQEEPKPQHSYIGLIAMAILSSPESKLVLSDIYHHILENYPYFRTRGPGWRNSIRHNLSLNDCFIKSGRSANGKGHYWAIHPANIEDFRRGDFRRRKAQRKVRKHMGLAVDDDCPDSPSPPPLSPLLLSNLPTLPHPSCSSHSNQALPTSSTIRHNWPIITETVLSTSPPSKKRQFDVASLLAPDNDIKTDIEIDVDVVANGDDSEKVLDAPRTFNNIPPHVLRSVDNDFLGKYYSRYIIHKRSYVHSELKDPSFSKE